MYIYILNANNFKEKQGRLVMSAHTYFYGATHAQFWGNWLPKEEEIKNVQKFSYLLKLIGV